MKGRSCLASWLSAAVAQPGSGCLNDCLRPVKFRENRLAGHLPEKALSSLWPGSSLKRKYQPLGWRESCGQAAVVKSCEKNENGDVAASVFGAQTLLSQLAG